MCAVSITPGLIGAAAFVGGIVGGGVAALWRNAWWVGSLSFSAPLCLGLPFAAEAARTLGVRVCVAAAFLVAFVVRYPGPSSLKS